MELLRNIEVILSICASTIAILGFLGVAKFTDLQFQKKNKVQEHEIQGTITSQPQKVFRINGGRWLLFSGIFGVIYSIIYISIYPYDFIMTFIAYPVFFALGYSTTVFFSKLILYLVGYKSNIASGIVGGIMVGVTFMGLGLDDLDIFKNSIIAGIVFGLVGMAIGWLIDTTST